jgi:toxin CptA
VQFPITIGLHRSFLLEFFGICLFLVAAGSIVAGPWHDPWPHLLFGLLFVAALIFCRQLRQPVHSLRLAKDGSISLRFCGRDAAFYPVCLLAPATVLPWLCVLHIEYGGHRFRLRVLPDSIAPEDFRRLRVWLKWRATFLPLVPGALEPYS